MTDRPVLVLCSGSPHRCALLERLGLPFEVSVSEVDELPLADEAPRALAQRLAEAKARAGAAEATSGLYLGSDQVAELDGTLLRKPGERTIAQAQLVAASGKCVHFHTAIYLLDAATGHGAADLVGYEVHFRSLTEAEIGRYLDRERPYDCAAAFKSEGLGAALVERMTGDDPTALIGLPLTRLVVLLRRHGIGIP